MNIDHFDTKTRALFTDLARLAQQARAAGVSPNLALSDAGRALKRAIKREETLSGEWAREEVIPQRGPRIEFTGRLLASERWDTRGRDPLHIEFEIWETKAGAMVGVFSSEPNDRDGTEVVRAIVVERQDDETAMHMAIMDFFDWGDRARSMAKKLGWNLRLDLD